MANPSTPHTPPPASTPADMTPDMVATELSPSPSPTVVGPPVDARQVTVCIPADAEYVLAVRLAVTGVATRMRFSFDQIEEIKLAVSEACNNAILHARPSGPDRPLAVTVQLVPREDELEIWVTDEGHVPPPGLPVRRAMSSTPVERSDDGVARGDVLDTYDPLSELPEGGLGLVLIRELMDEVEHFTGADHHTSVRMVKRIGGSAESGSAKSPA